MKCDYCNESKSIEELRKIAGTFMFCKECLERLKGDKTEGEKVPEFHFGDLSRTDAPGSYNTKGIIKIRKTIKNYDNARVLTHELIHKWIDENIGTLSSLSFDDVAKHGPYEIGGDEEDQSKWIEIGDNNDRMV